MRRKRYKLVAESQFPPTRKTTENPSSSATIPTCVIWITQRFGSRAIATVYTCMIPAVSGPATRIMNGRFSAPNSAMNTPAASGLRML